MIRTKLILFLFRSSQNEANKVNRNDVDPEVEFNIFAPPPRPRHRHWNQLDKLTPVYFPYRLSDDNNSQVFVLYADSEGAVQLNTLGVLCVRIEFTFCSV